MKVAMVGVTGMVGQVMLKVLAERNFPITEFIPVASKRSVGQKIEFNKKPYSIVDIETALAEKPNLALFSAGGELSKNWAPKFADIGCKVVDNSSAWRMESYINLVVPEINGDRLSEKDRIIANPNCSTIQLLMALAPVHREFNVKRVIVSTYQSVTGTGKAAVDQLENEEQGKKGEMAYPYAIYRNALPHCDVFQDNDYTKEEMKLTRETKKILDENIDLTATAVRIPVEGGHGESVHIELEREADVKKIKELLNNTKGVVLQDQPEINKYPMPIYSHGKDDVFVGRIRKDFTRENAYHLWIVADNLRKGAATNAVQIAEKLLEKGLLTA